MNADVVIVAYRNEAEIDACLDALEREPEVATITVVDNADGASGRRAAAHGVAVRYEPENPGFGTAVNRGANTGTAAALLVLNPDALLQPGALAAGLRRLDDDPTIGVVQGAIVNATTGAPERSAGREIDVVHLLGRLFGLRALLGLAPVRSLARRTPALADHVDRRPPTDTDVEVLAATAILVRRAAFEAVGGFDERYFLYGEDLDLCARLRRADWRLVAAPETWAVHRSGGSASTSWDRELFWWQGTLQFARSNWRGWRRPAATTIGVLETIVLLARSPSRAREAMRALRAGRSRRP